MQEICSLYSEDLLRKATKPCFRSWYSLEFRDGFHMPVHRHGAIEVMYVRKGSCSIYADDLSYKLENGDFILINGGIPHRLDIDREAPCKVLCLEFSFVPSDEALCSIMQVYDGAAEVRELVGKGRSHIVLRDLEEIYHELDGIYKELENGRPGSELSIQAAFCQFVIKLARLFSENEAQDKSPADRYAKKAMEYMNANYHRDIGIEQVAGHLNLNASYFHKIFKKTVGVTPAEYLNGIRLNKAKLLLSRSDIPVIEICGFAGFNSRQYFSNAFKKHTGMSPVEYRKSFQRASFNEALTVNNSCSGYFGRP